jgi:YD repeat-containing protein
MKIKLWRKIGLALLVSVTLLSFFIYSAGSEEVKYIYDDVGRLYQAVDGRGNVATYNYDSVGNLLSVSRGTGGLTPPIVTDISPNAAEAWSTVTVTISGNYLANTAVSINNPGVSIINVHADQNSITVTLDISLLAPPGPATVTVSNALGSAQIGFMVNLPGPRPA